MQPARTILLPLSLMITACSAWLPAAHQPPGTLDSAAIPATLGADSGDWPAAQWWHKYGDDTLDALIAQAMANGPSIANAEARFNNARESVRVTAAAAGLRVNAQAAVSRQRLSDNGLFSPDFLGFNWYNQADLGLQASYSFDWWHKQRAITAAVVDQARAAQAERGAAALALTAAVADSYFGWQADQTQLALLEEQQQLVMRRQKIAALRTGADLDGADEQYQLDGDLAALRAAHAQFAAAADLRRVVIAALLGVGTEQLPEFIVKPLPAVNAQLPDSVRVDLLARRPDIVASRWRIEAAQQDMRAARAEFMPDFSINALAALSSIELDKLFTTGSSVPSLGLAMHLPIFTSGLLRARYGAKSAQLDAAIASYNATVISAAREVTTQAITLRQLGEQRRQRQLQIDAAQQLVRANQARHRQGLSDGRPVLIANQTLQQQRAALASVEAAALTADINLQLALGGGYRQLDVLGAL